jgi:tRNA-dihydrouridine synthase A
VDGTMLGRAAYKSPALLRNVDRIFFEQDGGPAPKPHAVLEAMLPYVAAELEKGTKLSSITRHMTGLLNGKAGARRFRRLLTEESIKPGAGLEVLEAAIALARSQAEDGAKDRFRPVRLGERDVSFEPSIAEPRSDL